MKKIIVSIVVVCVFAISAIAQIPGNATKSGNSLRIEITPQAGYFLGGSVKFYEGKLKIQNQASFGVTVGMELSKGVMLEFNYTGMSSTADWRPNFNYENQYPSRSFGMNVNYFTLGGVREIPISEQLVGFGKMGIGAAYFNSTANDVSDLWRFAVSLGGGLKVYLSDRIGLRFQGDMNLPLYFAGGGLFCGIGSGGSGCGVSVGATSTIIQGNFTGGLIFRL